MVNLVLHIGSHKTASTSLQHFCTKNKDTLEKNGFYYPAASQSAYTHNFLAANLAFGRAKDTYAFLERARQAALDKNCHSVVISAESFYAMTAFFLDYYDRERPSSDYSDSEKAFIEMLADAVTSYQGIKIICYLRPQDEFAGSLYNQLVKSAHGTTLSYEDCIEKIRHAFDYKTHIDLWRTVFKDHTVNVFNFTESKKDILEHFSVNALSKKCFEEASNTTFISNERLNRDVMEVKRSFNYLHPDPALAYVSYCVFNQINDNFPDKLGWQILAPLCFAKSFFEKHQKDNDALAKTYEFKNLPALLQKQEPSYPGLSIETKKKIVLRLIKKLNTPRSQIEIFIRRGFHCILKASPKSLPLVNWLRKWVYRFRLNLQGW